MRIVSRITRGQHQDYLPGVAQCDIETKEKGGNYSINEEAMLFPLFLHAEEKYDC